MDSKTLMIIGALMLAATGAYMAFHPQEASELTAAFENFKVQYSKVYATEEEEAYRFAVYVKNLKMIEEHNNSGASYTMGENHMADLTNDEFRSIYLGTYQRENNQMRLVDELLEQVDSGVTEPIDWRTEGAVQRVKDQGQCGSCWAFSTVASTESFDFISTGVLGDFSEQQLVDCSKSYGNNGCKGGLMDYGFRYFAAHGICTESSYEYTHKDGTCRESTCTKSDFTITGYHDVIGGTVGLKEAIKKQPVSIAVDAQKWSLYKSGIYDNCGTSLDHGVLLVGIDAEESWIVKNSWGPAWGEEGYIRLKSGNTCGLANQPSYPK